MKILLFGKNGQVGRELQLTLPALGQLIALGREKADLENSEEVERALHMHAPDIIVNAAAYTAVDEAEVEEAIAIKVNAHAVQVMAGYARANNALLVHYSTDYVFDGEKMGAYTENDVPNPINAYGRSKLAGEEAILHSGCHTLIFRTSWVFSVHGNNFVKTVMRLAKEHQSLSIVADQVGTPTSAELIADLTTQAITAWRNKAMSEGIYHLTATGHTTWHHLAVHIVERLQNQGAALPLHHDRILSITTQEHTSLAKRPKNSRLNMSKLQSALDIKPPRWIQHVDHIVDRLTHLYTQST